MATLTNTITATMATLTNSTTDTMATLINTTTATMATTINTTTPAIDEPLPSIVSREVVILVSILLFVFGLVGNGFICYGFCRFHQLRTLTNYFVFNLSIADLLLILALGAWIVQEIRGNPPHEGFLMALLINIDVLCFSASMLNMTAVSVDRFCAVTYPFTYEQIVTKSRARKATVLIWAYSLLMAGIGVTRFLVDEMDVSHSKIFVTVLSVISFVIPATIMVFTHSCIFKIAWATKRRTQYDLQDVEGGRSNEITKTLKLSFNTLVILVPMITAWGIFYGVTVLEAHCLDCFQLSPAFSVTAGLLPHVAAAIDPIVYILVTRDLRLKLCACSWKPSFIRTQGGNVNAL